MIAHTIFYIVLFGATALVFGWPLRKGYQPRHMVETEKS